jgi:hypothetical protein
MVSENAFSGTGYRQYLKTCVLASYAVAAYPFVNIPVLDFFVAYCCDHGLPHQHPERSYDDDFHRWPNGYDVIWKLHHDSTVPTFKACREAFRLVDARAVDLATIEQRLATEKNTTFMLFINQSNREQDLGLASRHSIAVACSPDREFFYYDTGLGKVVENFGSLADLGDCGDRFLLIGRG